MSTQHDPEGIEPKYLYRFANLADAHVLEIGCGDGRLTWRYANGAKRVTATDPDFARLITAQHECSPTLNSSITLTQAAAEGLPFPVDRFDLALLAWSL